MELFYDKMSIFAPSSLPTLAKTSLISAPESGCLNCCSPPRVLTLRSTMRRVLCLLCPCTAEDFSHDGPAVLPHSWLSRYSSTIWYKNWYCSCQNTSVHNVIQAITNKADTWIKHCVFLQLRLIHPLMAMFLSISNKLLQLYPIHPLKAMFQFSNIYLQLYPISPLKAMFQSSNIYLQL